MIRHLQGHTSCLPTHAKIALTAAKETALHAHGCTGCADVGKLASRMGYSVGASDRLMCSTLSSLSHGLHAHTVLLEMENRYQYGQVRNKTSREAHLITTRNRRGNLGEGWLDAAAC